MADQCVCVGMVDTGWYEDMRSMVGASTATGVSGILLDAQGEASSIQHGTARLWFLCNPCCNAFQLFSFFSNSHAMSNSDCP